MPIEILWFLGSPPVGGERLYRSHDQTCQRQQHNQEFRQPEKQTHMARMPPPDLRGGGSRALSRRELRFGCDLKGVCGPHIQGVREGDVDAVVGALVFEDAATEQFDGRVGGAQKAA